MFFVSAQLLLNLDWNNELTSSSLLNVPCVVFKVRVRLLLQLNSLKFRFRSFKTIQCFNQDSNQILALSGSTEFSVVLWYLYHFFLLQLPLSFLLKLDLGYGSFFTNHFSLERR